MTPPFESPWVVAIRLPSALRTSGGRFPNLRMPFRPEPASPSRGDFFPLRGNAPLRTAQAFEANAKSCAIAPHRCAHPHQLARLETS